MFYGGDYNPEQWPEKGWKEDREGAPLSLRRRRAIIRGLQDSGIFRACAP